MLGYLERLSLMNGCSSIFVLSKFPRISFVCVLGVRVS